MKTKIRFLALLFLLSPAVSFAQGRAVISNGNYTSRVDERPALRQNQVVSADSLVTGNHYWLKHGNESGIEVEFLERDGDWILVRHVVGDYIKKHHVGDSGLDPYKNGKWSRTNWVEKDP